MEENYELYFHGDTPFKGSQITIGAVLVLNGQILDQLGGAVDYSGTSQRAHWEALIQGMHLAADNGVKRVIMKGDSRNVINHMNGQPPDRDFDSMDYYMLARKTQLNFDQCFFQWVPQEKNLQAIRLARTAGTD
ncbi:MAG: reverse transcriptase-like protein [Thermoplasmatota archaeon]